MTAPLLLAIALAIILVLAFPSVHTLWVIKRATSGRTQVAAGQRPCGPGSVELEVRVDTPGRTVTIVEVEVDRAFCEAVALGRPDGFRYNPQDESATAPWVRYTGSLEVGAGRPVCVTFPIDAEVEGSGDVRLRYAELIGVGGGSLGFTVVRVTTGRGER